ncbi:MAG: hypothetical protein JSW50_06860 [Candidatus Latescibacterota bacterium]|nr:MAG: hypothetical protein JSW50_06860 [Candidatus Latescibacterota bacterium]
MASGDKEVVECNNNLFYADGGIAVLCPIAECMCEGGAVAVEESTWGCVKALYAPEKTE